MRFDESVHGHSTIAYGATAKRIRAAPDAK